MADTPWPFHQPPHCVAVTTTQVRHDKAAITRVYHDADDHGWPFHSHDAFSSEEALLVAMHTVVDVDPSLLEIAKLPPGWMAGREGIGHPWHWIRQHD